MSAFVRFASMSAADQVIKQLQNVILPGSSHSLQLRWADGEEERLGFAGIPPQLRTKLYVGSLPKQAKEEDIKEVFSRYGKIEEIYLMRESDLSSKCAAFVVYENKESALLAIRNFNAQAYILDSQKPIEVKFAENKQSPQIMPLCPPQIQSSMMDLIPSQMGQVGYEINDMAHLSKGQGPPGSNLFIFHLPNEWKESDLHMVFQIYGNILSSRIMTDKETKKSKGYGFISYDNPTSAMQAMQNMNGYQANSSKLFVKKEKRLKVQIKKGEGDDLMGMGQSFNPY